MKRNFKNLISLVLVTAITATALTGCGTKTDAEDTADKGNPTEETQDTTDKSIPGTASSEETVITFGIHVADPQNQEPVSYQIVEAFNQKYAGQYKVEFEAAEKSSHDTNMKLQAADQTLPEIFWMDSAMAPEFQKAGYLLDLNDFLNTYSNIDSALDSSVKEAFREEIQYGLPYQCNVSGFFYNKQVFADVGIEEPVNGMTYEEFLTMIQKLSDAGITPIAQGSVDTYAIWAFLPMLDRYGYSEYIYDILAEKKGFQREELISYFTKLQELGIAKAFPSNMATLSYFDAKVLFEAGKAAIMNTGAWDCSEFDEKLGENIGFWWGPTFKDSTYEQKRAMKVPSAPLCVSASVAKDDSIQEATYKFLEFYYSEEAANITYAGSCFPATNYTNVTIADSQYSLTAVMKALSEGWTSPKSQPDQILSSAIQSQLYDSMLGVMLGNYTPEEALTKMDDALSYE